MLIPGAEDKRVPGIVTLASYSSPLRKEKTSARTYPAGPGSVYPLPWLLTYSPWALRKIYLIFEENDVVYVTKRV
jgi:hypothetical protein